MNRYFPEIKGQLGFGCMRLPMKGVQVDAAQFAQMVDEFLAAGFNYFDTAHGYLSGESEPALKVGLTSRYPRDRYILTTKLTANFFNHQEDIRPLFESQLEICGVDYFDFYLMHAQGAGNYSKFKKCRAYETALELKSEGKIRHFGISFHDTADMLEQILTEYPQVEVVQLQINYADWEDSAVQSRLCYEVCQKHGKPVIVMEPVKGGSLVKLPPKAQTVLDALHGGSNASYALRFAAGLENVMVALSGMSDIAQLRDNISTMGYFKPLTAEEHKAVEQVSAIIREQNLISCTACRYCTDGCPMHIAIPDLFSCMNAKKNFQDWNSDYYYGQVYTKTGGKASDCIKCGKCEAICPQHLPIREFLTDVAKTFE